MAFTKSQLILIGIGVVIFLFIVLLFMGVVPGLRSTETPDISGNLTMWGATDSPSTVQTLIAAYNAIHPNVAITYTQMNEATYETDVVEALAAGKGPDIFMIKNAWATKHANKLVGLTAEQFPLSRLESEFPKVISSDLAWNASTTFALPLYLDTLVLYYNKDLFDNAGLANPPTTWEELDSLIPRLRSLDATQKIVRSAIALGGSLKSVSRATDILSLMMLQDGTQMIAPDHLDASFARDGGDALAYYTDFANPGSPLYTWNDNMGTDFDLFAAGNVAMMIGFSGDAARIKEKNPFLRFGMSPMLQKKDAALAVNYPSYWALAVPNTGKNVGLAWDFVGTVTLNSEIISDYLDASGKSPALRSLIAQKADDRETGFIVRQALTAQSWLQPDASAVETIFSKMINSILTGQLSRDKAIRSAEEDVTSLLRKRFKDEL
ncbi:MAG: extracellular solute-binding protein [bacterium]|nr:extracellular solute-binding protein [bacterium]